MPLFRDTLSWSIATLFEEDGGDPRARLKDAELLLAYCVRNGIEVSSGSLSAVLNARHEIKSAALTSATESALWNGLDELSRTAAPVTVFALRVNTKLWKTFYGILFVGVLVLVLWLQFFWFIGTTLTNDLSSLQKQAQLAATALAQGSQNATPDTASVGSQASLAGQNPTKNGASEGVGPPAQQESADAVPPGAALNNYLTLQAAIQSKEHLLSNWVRNAARFSPIQDTLANSRGDRLLANDDLQTHAPLLLGGLRLYALPLLYGLLGAFVYVLRRIAKDGELYTGEGDWIRICFGSAAGIGMGLFFGQDAPQLQVFGSIQSTVSSLSPFALAFAGGYSADILFAALDQLVFAFSGGLGGTRATPTNGTTNTTANEGKGLRRTVPGIASVVPAQATATPANGTTTNAPLNVGAQHTPSPPVPPVS